MRLLITLCCLGCMAGILSAAQAQDRAGLVEREANALQAFTREPGHQQLLSLGDGAPFPEHRNQFDAAFAACRQALKTNPQDTAVRVNLGALYLWRDALHPEESGNFEKAIDQFLIVLEQDSGNETALTYLRSYEVLMRVRPHLGEKGMEHIRSALQRTLKDPPGVANLRTFARVEFFDGHLIEARVAAEALTELAPEASSQLLLGSVELKSAHADKALTAFQTALKLTHDPVEVATAKLGAAQAQKALGNTAEADRMLSEATSSLPLPSLDRAAQVAGLNTPAELGWSIGKDYAATGNVPRALDFLGIEGMSWLSSETASKKNEDGVKLFEANDVPGARNAFVAAAQLIPMETVYWRNAGAASFELGRYKESMVAYRRADALEPLEKTGTRKLAISYAVLGDYRKARAMFERSARDFPENPEPGKMSAATWAVALSYAEGGWDEALATWSRLVRNGAQLQGTEKYDVFVHVWGGIRNIADRAEKRGARYQSLRHESVLYHLLGEGLKRSFLSREGREQIRHEREESFNRIIGLYRALPLKPVITPDVLELVQKAQPFVDSAFDDFNSQYQAVGLYQQVIERAPWWPEGHYTLALLACWQPSLYAFGEISNVDSGWVAGREMNAYLALISEGPEAAAARKILKGCNQR